MTQPITYGSQIVPALVDMAMFYGFALAGWLIVRMIRRRVSEVTQ